MEEKEEWKEVLKKWWPFEKRMKVYGISVYWRRDGSLCVCSLRDPEKRVQIRPETDPESYINGLEFATLTEDMDISGT